MGLGKTHQAMALMAWLREHQKEKAPFLVVCPTTVISHWRNKIREHAPKLKAQVHHGTQRNAKEALAAADVLVTSYGVLRNDLPELEKKRFSLVISTRSKTSRTATLSPIERHRLLSRT